MIFLIKCLVCKLCKLLGGGNKLCVGVNGYQVGACFSQNRATFIKEFLHLRGWSNETNCGGSG